LILCSLKTNWYKDKLTPDQIKAIEAARTKIASGELKVPFVPK
jgi:simple sugar transport system substrate-binding protein/basic membrane protein A